MATWQADSECAYLCMDDERRMGNAYSQLIRESRERYVRQYSFFNFHQASLNENNSKVGYFLFILYLFKMCVYV